MAKRESSYYHQAHGVVTVGCEDSERQYKLASASPSPLPSALLPARLPGHFRSVRYAELEGPVGAANVSISADPSMERFGFDQRSGYIFVGPGTSVCVSVRFSFVSGQS